MVMYPLFHRPLRNNVLWLSANPLQRHAFVNEPREDKFLMEHSFYEFFAGGGMARAGLGPGWNCLFANDFDHKKGRVYRFNWGDAQLKTGLIPVPRPFSCRRRCWLEGRPVRYILAVLEPDVGPYQRG